MEQHEAMLERAKALLVPTQSAPLNRSDLRALIHLAAANTPPLRRARRKAWRRAFIEVLTQPVVAIEQGPKDVVVRVRGKTVLRVVNGLPDLQVFTEPHYLGGWNGKVTMHGVHPGHDTLQAVIERYIEIAGDGHWQNVFRDEDQHRRQEWRERARWRRNGVPVFGRAEQQLTDACEIAFESLAPGLRQAIVRIRCVSDTELRWLCEGDSDARWAFVDVHAANLSHLQYPRPPHPPWHKSAGRLLEDGVGPEQICQRLHQISPSAACVFAGWPLDWMVPHRQQPHDSTGDWFADTAERMASVARYADLRRPSARARAWQLLRDLCELPHDQFDRVCQRSRFKNQMPPKLDHLERHATGNLLNRVRVAFGHGIITTLADGGIDGLIRLAMAWHAHRREVLTASAGATSWAPILAAPFVHARGRVREVTSIAEAMRCDPFITDDWGPPGPGASAIMILEGIPNPFCFLARVDADLSHPLRRESIYFEFIGDDRRRHQSFLYGEFRDAMASGAVPITPRAESDTIWAYPPKRARVKALRLSPHEQLHQQLKADLRHLLQAQGYLAQPAATSLKHAVACGTRRF